MIEINQKMNLKDCYGGGVFVRDKVLFNAWGLNKKTIIETPVSIGNTAIRGIDQFDVGFIGAFTYINGKPNNRYYYRSTNIDATKIGRFCMISQGCQIGAAAHPTNSLTASAVFSNGNFWCDNYYTYPKESVSKWLDEITPLYKESISRPLPEIGNDVWIGAGVTIINGVKIGDGAIIAAGAVVNKDVQPYEIVGGVPAKHIKYRFDEQIIKQLIDLKWWNYGVDIMVGINIYDLVPAIRTIKERIEDGFSEYIPESFEFHWEKNTVYKLNADNRKFYTHIDQL